MPRKYVPNPLGKRYTKYDNELIQRAVEELKSNKGSIKVVADKYGITKSTLHRHNTRNLKPQGGQPALTQEEEDIIVESINKCTDWSMPMGKIHLRYIIKMHLDAQGIAHKRFKDNLPGVDYINGFLKRNQHRISKELCLKRCTVKDLNSDTINRLKDTVHINEKNSQYDELESSVRSILEGKTIEDYSNIEPVFLIDEDCPEVPCDAEVKIENEENEQTFNTEPNTDTNCDGNGITVNNASDLLSLNIQNMPTNTEITLDFKSFELKIMMQVNPKKDVKDTTCQTNLSGPVSPVTNS